MKKEVEKMIASDRIACKDGALEKMFERVCDHDIIDDRET